jgi:hypothetical protein
VILLFSEEKATDTGMPSSETDTHFQLDRKMIADFLLNILMQTENLLFIFKEML